MYPTYSPYEEELKKHGFIKIASTKDNLKLLVVDALFTTQKMFDNHKTQFVELKKLIDNALEALKNNPQEFYETIKPYMPELEYKEFIYSLNGIIWINKKISMKLKERMKESNFPTYGVI